VKVAFAELPSPGGDSPPLCGTTVHAGGFVVEVDRRDTLGLGFHGGYEHDVEHAIDKSYRRAAYS
jgi:hypothetical protein